MFKFKDYLFEGVLRDIVQLGIVDSRTLRRAITSRALAINTHATQRLSARVVFAITFLIHIDAPFVSHDIRMPSGVVIAGVFGGYGRTDGCTCRARRCTLRVLRLARYYRYAVDATRPRSCLPGRCTSTYRTFEC